MRNLLIFIAVIFCFAASPAKLFADNTEKINAELNALSARLNKLSSVKSVSADYTQQRYISELDMKMTIHGKMYFEKEKRLLWICNTPVNCRFLISENGLSQYDGESGSVFTLEGSKQPWLKLLWRNTAAWMSGDIAALQKEFSLSVDGENRLLLIPVKENTKGFFKSVSILFNDAFDGISEIEIIENSGDKISIKFSEIQNDITINPAVWNLPPDEKSN
jgi:outer membrane lipoprotein-sorting protein